MSRVLMSAIVKVSVDAHGVGSDLDEQSRSIGPWAWIRTLDHPGPSGCCTDLCDDKCTAWHLTVESLLALTDLVGSGVGQSHLDDFKCNMISCSGFSVTRVGNRTGSLWSPSVLQRWMSQWTGLIAINLWSWGGDHSSCDEHILPDDFWL